MKIGEFMDLKKLQRIQDHFSAATGLAAIAVDADGKYITKGSHFTDFCMKYTRGSEEGAKRCVKCDTECSGTYFCHAGLMDFASDIMVEGEKVGAIIGGQVLPEAPDEDKFRAIAKELGINPDSYIKALKAVPIRSEQSIRAAAGLLAEIVNEVVNLEYMKYKNSRHLNVYAEELETATKEVEEINRMTGELDGIASKQKILSLNASIESARAGTVGAGFAIVAKEMGDLTAKSSELYGNIENSARKIRESVRKMNESSSK